MLAEARTFADVRKVRAIAKGAQAYAKAHSLGVDARNEASDLIIEADILGAEKIREERERGELIPASGGKPAKNGQVMTLGGLKVSYKQAAVASDMLDEAVAVRAWKADAKAKRREISEHRAARVARDAKAKRKRETEPPPILPATCDLRCGDFRTALADVPDTSIDVILTDPPYPAAFLPLWSDLAVFAKRVLKPTGMLVAMSGQANLPDVMLRLGEHLTYRWMIAFMMPGAANVVHARKVHTNWKPVLVYGSSDRRLFDIVQSEKAGKEHHDWEQSESGMAGLLRLVADPGATICDPFVGAGTTALVSLAADCSFIGAEIDPATHWNASERLAG